MPKQRTSGEPQTPGVPGTAQRRGAAARAPGASGRSAGRARCGWGGWQLLPVCWAHTRCYYGPGTWLLSAAGSGQASQSIGASLPETGEGRGLEPGVGRPRRAVLRGSVTQVSVQPVCPPPPCFLLLPGPHRTYLFLVRTCVCGVPSPALWSGSGRGSSALSGLGGILEGHGQAPGLCRGTRPVAVVSDPHAWPLASGLCWIRAGGLQPQCACLMLCCCACLLPAVLDRQLERSWPWSQTAWASVSSLQIGFIIASPLRAMGVVEGLRATLGRSGCICVLGAAVTKYHQWAQNNRVYRLSSSSWKFQVMVSQGFTPSAGSRGGSLLPLPASCGSRCPGLVAASLQPLLLSSQGFSL